MPNSCGAYRNRGVSSKQCWGPGRSEGPPRFVRWCRHSVCHHTFVALPPADTGRRGNPLQSGVKGRVLALTLVRDRAGGVSEAPTTFAPTDRFAVLVTCSGAKPQAWDLAVLQAGEVSFPLDASVSFSCGNRVALPGAFHISGDAAAKVCVLLAPDLPERDVLAAEGDAALPDSATCVTLGPAGD